MSDTIGSGLPGSVAAETETDFGEAPEGLAARWKAEIQSFQRERKTYDERVKKIRRLYRDEREQRGTDGRKFALLWANVEVMKPALYARPPKPEVSRRFRDRDPVGRVAGTLLERVLVYQVEREDAFDEAMGAVVQDVLLGGQGTGWVYYDFTPALPPAVAQDERARLSWVAATDFGFTAGARVWEEVTAVWRVAYMTRDDLMRRFGQEVGARVPLDRQRPDETQRGLETFGKAAVYEVWDSLARNVIWISLGVDLPLDAKPYPAWLRGKFPCPRPLFGTLTTGTMVPVPEYVHYQDQVEEINDLTARIAMLSKSLRMVGFTPGDAMVDVRKGLDSGEEVALVPVAAWAAFGAAQGRPMDNAIAWLPVEMVASTLARLVELREAVKRDAYEITGLSDILRGQSEASETATAQRIKSQWGGIRLRNRQRDVQRFAREALEIMADAICGNFEPDRISAEANAQGLPPAEQQHVPAALALLKGNGALRAYRVDVETDSTIEADEASQKEETAALLKGVADFLGATLPLVEGVARIAPPAAAPMTTMVGQLLLSAVRRYRVGPGVEDAIEQAMDALGQAGAQGVQQPIPGAPPPPEPDPVAMAKAETDRGRLQLDAAVAQDESRHRDADRAVHVRQMEMAALRPVGEA